MSNRLITAPSSYPVTLATAKAHCRVTGTDDDALIQAYIASATAMAEESLQRKIITQTWEMVIDAFPSAEILLPFPSVQSITSVTYVSGGSTLTLSNTKYALDNADRYESWLFPAPGNEWPVTDDAANAVVVRYVTGYGDASAVPPGIANWIIMHVAAMYDNRAAINEREMKPLSFLDSLIAAERVWRAA
jgi:uncharacterized phiE125 gp8 family phage protein